MTFLAPFVQGRDVSGEFRHHRCMRSSGNRSAWQWRVARTATRSSATVSDRAMLAGSLCDLFCLPRSKMQLRRPGRRDDIHLSCGGWESWKVRASPVPEAATGHDSNPPALQVLLCKRGQGLVWQGASRSARMVRSEVSSRSISRRGGGLAASCGLARASAPTCARGSHRRSGATGRGSRPPAGLRRGRPRASSPR